MAAAVTTTAAAPTATGAAQTGSIVGRLIATIDEANPGVAVVSKVTGNMGAAPHQTIAMAALRMLQDVTLLAEINKTLTPFQRILCLSCCGCNSFVPALLTLSCAGCLFLFALSPVVFNSDKRQGDVRGAHEGQEHHHRRSHSLPMSRKRWPHTANIKHTKRTSERDAEN